MLKNAADNNSAIPQTEPHSEPHWEVRIETTPNPATLKFVFSQEISSQTHQFENSQDAQISPLASKLFGFPWTSQIFIGPDFVSVTKQDWVDWEVLSEPLAGLMKEHLVRGEAVVYDLDLSSEQNSETSENDSEIVKKIKHILKTEIRPVVALDGGDVAFASYNEGILAIQMKGACSGCPSSTATLKEGIEVRFKELLPEIKEVISVKN